MSVVLPEMVLRQVKPNPPIREEIEGLISDVGPVVGEPTLFLEPFLREGEKYVGKRIVIERVKQMPGLSPGLSHAELLLKQLENMPSEWRRYHKLYFPGTLRNFTRCEDCQCGIPSVACVGLRPTNREWQWQFFFESLAGDADSEVMVVRIRA